MVGTLSVETTRGKLSSGYRLSAIRQMSGFRTVSDEAVLVLAKTIPIDIWADKLSASQVFGINSGYINGETNNFHAQLAGMAGEQLNPL